MTVHGAKGLEFPIVFVPEVFRRQRPIWRDFLIDPHEDGKLVFFLAPKVPEDLPEAKQKTLREVTSRLAARLFDREEREVDAEERRLLYVPSRGRGSTSSSLSRSPSSNAGVLRRFRRGPTSWSLSWAPP